MRLKDYRPSCNLHWGCIRHKAFLHSVVTDHLPHGFPDSILLEPVTIVAWVIAHGLGRAVALSIANLSRQPSSVCIQDFEILRKHSAYSYGGSVVHLLCRPTVVDLTRQGNCKILRPGRQRWWFMGADGLAGQLLRLNNILQNQTSRRNRHDDP